MKNKLWILVLLLCSPIVSAQDFFPAKPSGFINDYANILSSAEKRTLERRLSAFHDTTTTSIVVATFESLQGYTAQEAANIVHNAWNIQYEDRGNGVLLLISQQDRSLWIEVGYGLEGAIPDILASRIVDQILLPQFRAGNFYGGIDEATTTLMQLAAGEYEGNLTRERDDDDFDPFPIIFTIFIILFLLTRRGRRRSYGPGGFVYWGGGFGGGGSSGFGGGGGGFGGGGFGGFGGGGGFSSGGGGAGGSW